MKTKNLIKSALIIIVFASCQEEITWNIDSKDERLIVEGSISTDSIQHGIFLSKTGDYFSSTLPPVVSGATVSVSDGVNTYSYAENDTMAGWYQMTSAIRGTIGTTYTLDIQLPETLGQSSRYTASTEIMPVSFLDSVNIELDTVSIFGSEEEIFWDVSSHFQEREPEGDFYRFNIYVNEIAHRDSLKRILVIDDDGFSGEYINATVLSLNLDELLPGDTITVEMQSVSEAYSQFISDIQEEADGRDPIGLDGPSANPFGNISNGALGFFVGSANSRAQLIVHE